MTASQTYGWSDAEVELAEGTHPAVVAARLGESEDYIREVAETQGWPITWDGSAKPAKWVDA